MWAFQPCGRLPKERWFKLDHLVCDIMSAKKAQISWVVGCGPTRHIKAIVTYAKGCKFLVSRRKTWTLYYYHDSPKFSKLSNLDPNQPRNLLPFFRLNNPKKKKIIFLNKPLTNNLAKKTV